MPKQRFGEIEPDQHGNRRCPKCGGSQFQAISSTGRRVTMGLASLVTLGAASFLSTQNEVRCLGCGTKYRMKPAKVGPPPNANLPVQPPPERPD
jgi:DNA-directed RNA polymerase subunit RPC12/RpoP